MGHRLVLTKLDVLDGLATVKICTGYLLDGARIDHLPARLGDALRLRPVYEELEGWSDSTQGVREWVRLPVVAQRYVRRVEALIGPRLFLLGTSPQRDETIVLQNSFAA